LKAVLGDRSSYRSRAFWDNELAGSKSFYLDGTPYVAVRASVVGSLIRHGAPDARSLLDVGCGGGGLLRVFSNDGLEQYVGVDISEYAVKKAQETLRKDVGLPSTRFYASDLCAFSPDDGQHFDVIVFNEVLYYLDVDEAVGQVERYSKWLQPNGILCISMKDDPKCHAIYRGISRGFEHVNSILFQTSRPHHGIKYRIVVDEEIPVFSIGLFSPRGKS